MADKKCPQCDLWSTGSALYCDCGYNFKNNLVTKPNNKLNKPAFEEKLNRDWIIFLATGGCAILLFVAVIVGILFFIGPGIVRQFFLTG